MSFTSKKLQQKKGGMGFIKGATLFFLGMSCILFMTKAFDITPTATNAVMYMSQIFLTQSGNNSSATGISLDGIGGEVRLLNTLRIGSNVFTSFDCGNADVCGVSLLSRDFYSNGGDASFLGGDFGIGYDIGNSSNGGNLYVSNNVGIGTNAPQARLDVNGGVRIGNDIDDCDEYKVGTMKYRYDGSNCSHVEMCMQSLSDDFLRKEISSYGNGCL